MEKVTCHCKLEFLWALTIVGKQASLLLQLKCKLLTVAYQPKWRLKNSCKQPNQPRRCLNSTQVCAHTWHLKKSHVCPLCLLLRLFAVWCRIKMPRGRAQRAAIYGCWKPRLFMRALCHMASRSIEPRLLDNLNISQWRQITTLVESSGLPPLPGLMWVSNILPGG